MELTEEPNPVRCFFMKQILKPILYLGSSETSDLILYPHLFLVDEELSLMCCVHKRAGDTRKPQWERQQSKVM